jgi:PAS domain S-box-containing protein
MKQMTKTNKAPSTRDLERRLAEAEATIKALLSGEIDAVVDSRTSTPVLLSKAQEALRESEARFTSLSESGIIGMLVIDVTGRIVEANDTFLKMVGLTRNALHPGVLRVRDITAPAQDEAGEVSFEQMRKQGMTGLFEKIYLRRDGSRVPVLIGAAMLDAQRIISFILDLTERKRLEQVSRQAFELELQNLRIQEETRLKSEFRPGTEERDLPRPRPLKQVLYNFISNALKFTPAGGAVSIRVRERGEDSLLLEVEDDGPGIAPEDIARLFVEFQQLEGGTDREHSGTGLGLALTRSLAEAQGGSAGVRSTLGKGSVFHVILPRRSPASPVQRRFPA